MSAQVTRCIRILALLSGGRKLSTQDIITSVADADTPRVSQRQIQRDLRSIEQAGVPLVCERDGREQRWFIPSRFRSLQPLTVSRNDVLALHLLKGALGAYTSTRIEKDVGILRRKLERLVPGSVFLSEESALDVSPGRYATAVDDHVMEQILFAITDPHWDRVTYRSIHGMECKTFVVSFCRMINHAGRLYVAAWHPKYEQYITLAADRIESVERADDVTDPLHVFDERAYRSGRFGVYDGAVATVRLRIDASASDFFASRQWHPSQQITRRRDGSLNLTLKVPLSAELVSWIVSWADVLEILAPKQLTSICRDKVKRLMSTADL
ncbi:MAG: WYL domain-containing protein [Candidatus Kapabacteria bacterium]|nr:WYL domain-containing protein [Candidatus Kapabacteria bacterium]